MNEASKEYFTPAVVIRTQSLPAMAQSQYLTSLLLLPTPFP